MKEFETVIYFKAANFDVPIIIFYNENGEVSKIECKYLELPKSAIDLTFTKIELVLLKNLIDTIPSIIYIKEYSNSLIKPIDFTEINNNVLNHNVDLESELYIKHKINVNIYLMYFVNNTTDWRWFVDQLVYILEQDKNIINIRETSDKLISLYKFIELFYHASFFVNCIVNTINNINGHREDILISLPSRTYTSFRKK